jgi:hypothetical protein
VNFIIIIEIKNNMKKTRNSRTTTLEGGNVEVGIPVSAEFPRGG